MVAHRPVFAFTDEWLVPGLSSWIDLVTASNRSSGRLAPAGP
jgi:hypothetical protein